MGSEITLSRRDEMDNIKVSVRYASGFETAPHESTNPYYPMQLTLTGEVRTVANWIDEHLEVFDAVMAGVTYVQGSSVEEIKKALLKGGVQIFGNIAFFVTIVEKGG